MSKTIGNLKIEFSRHVRSVEALLLEGENVTATVIPSGSGWVFEVDQFITKDNDLDVAFTIKGDPGVKATITINGAGLNPAKTTTNATFKHHEYVSSDVTIQC